MAAKKRHQVSQSENGRAKSPSASHHKSKSGRMRENGHSSSKSLSGSDNKLPSPGYVLLVTALGKLLRLLMLQLSHLSCIDFHIIPY